MNEMHEEPSDEDGRSSQRNSDLRPSNDQDTTQLNVEIPTELHRRLKMYSARTGKSMKRVVTDILDMNLGA
jgi:predicted HicB family RNase H-like nuclease